MSDARSIRVERVLDAPPEEVFAAWGDAESLAVFMCPSSEMERATVETDFRVGGGFRIVMHGAEQDYVQHGEYLELVPGERLVFTWISEWMPVGETATRVTVTLAPAPDGRTRLELVHDGLPSEGDSYAGHPDGWKRILERLAAALAAA